MKELKLENSSLFAFVDDNDYIEVTRYKWWLIKCNGKPYAMTGSGHNGTRWFLHQMILGYSEELDIDHLDNNGLNCQRSNIRYITTKDNIDRKGPQTNNTSGFKGVFLNRNSGKWVAQITVDGKCKHIVSTTDIIDAARAYDRAVINYKGSEAYTNFPRSEY